VKNNMKECVKIIITQNWGSLWKMILRKFY
jgi:hypothetical protein